MFGYFFSQNFESLKYKILSKKDFQIKIGALIRKLRKRQGVSQTDLAYRCNFEISNMNRIEAGNTNITSYNLYIITQALGITLTDFFEEFYSRESNTSSPHI